MALEDGRRYVVCVFANSTTIKTGHQDVHLPTVSACSDGVLADHEAPVAGHVWLGKLTEHQHHQVNEMYMYFHICVKNKQLLVGFNKMVLFT